MRIELPNFTAEAARLNRIIGNLGESKNSRNAARTLLNRLSAQAGRNLRAG